MADDSRDRYACRKRGAETIVLFGIQHYKNERIIMLYSTVKRVDCPDSVLQNRGSSIFMNENRDMVIKPRLGGARRIHAFDRLSQLLGLTQDFSEVSVLSVKKSCSSNLARFAIATARRAGVASGDIRRDDERGFEVHRKYYGVELNFLLQ